MDIFHLILFHIAQFFVLMIVALVFIVSVYIAPHYDALFPGFSKSRNSYENSFWILSPFARGMRYLGSIFFKPNKKNKTYRALNFQNYDFQKNARKIDWAIIYLTFIAHLGLILVFLILFISGGLHWPIKW